MRPAAFRETATVRAAERCGVRVVCLAVTPDSDSCAWRIFGRTGVQSVRDPRDVPLVLSRLMI